MPVANDNRQGPERMDGVMSRRGLIVWFTGLSGAGKTTLCGAVAEQLRMRGSKVAVLDGDELRRTVNIDLGYSRKDREENIRRIGELAEELAAQQTLVLVAAISPYRTMRDMLRKRLPVFVEVFVNAPLATCMERDTKGLYRRALAGEIASFTGVSDPYEPPLAPEVECNTAEESIEASAGKVMAALACMLTPPGVRSC
jgi:adenylylsulfate kinase